MLNRIYLDNSATTQVDEAVLAEMMPYFSTNFGNASSIHHFGQDAKMAVDRARHRTASLLNCRPNEIVFTSGGTESNNLAIRGLLEANSKYGKHVITSAIEHSAVKNVCKDLEARGFEVTYLPVYENGLVRIADVKNALRDNTILISIMFANNEIGTVQPVEEIGNLVSDLRKADRKIWFHTDAVQAAGKIGVDVEFIKCDLLSISGHKIYAPKGIGALYVRRGVRLRSQNVGGRQERDRRGGTEPVQNIVALGKACELAERNLATDSERIGRLRDRLESGIFETISNAFLNGEPAKRIPTIANISFDAVEGEGLLINLDMNGVAVSTGSACSSGSLEPSPVIMALGRNEQLSRSAIRFSLSKFTTDEEIDRVIEVLPKTIENLRRLAPKR